LVLLRGQTSTWRKAINAQNIPEEARKIFIPAPGRAFVSGDFSNLELRVMAFDFNDEVLQQMFKEGVNIHDANTKAMFGINKTHRDWDHIRKAAKIAVFGRSYGGGVRGIFERVSAKVPEFNFTMAMFRTADRRYFEAHPKLEKGFAEASRTARETRCCVTATGRKRFFLGTPDEVEREGINTRIQGAAGDIESESLIDLYEECQKHDDWKLVATVHDSNVIECRIEEVKLCASAMKRIMEKPRHLWGKDVIFPCDISVSSKSWGELEPLEDWLKAQKPATKRPRNTHHPKA
jgi:DNA polymerase I